MQLNSAAQRLPRFSIFFATIVVALATATAAPNDSRRGFRKFAAKYNGGYNVVSETGNTGGGATIQFRSSASGRTGSLFWKNSYTDEQGNQRSTRTVFRFRRSGTVIANTIDPRVQRLAATAPYTLNARRIKFTAAAGGTSTNAMIRLVGGGAMHIDLIIDSPENPATMQFNGGRR